MPIQPPPWTEFLRCPVCYQDFSVYRKYPLSLFCNHTVCSSCIEALYNSRCPFDHVSVGPAHPMLPVNGAILKLACLRRNESLKMAEILINSPLGDFAENWDFETMRSYSECRESMDCLAMHLKEKDITQRPLSRTMQKKMVMLLNTQFVSEEARMRALRIVRSLAERCMVEIIMHQQRTLQVSTHLWAAVRSRGCQFLGPAIQEEVLRHLLAMLACGRYVSRKVLVMNVVQNLRAEEKPVSKTSVGHVVQLLYRASCFKLSKRECDSSLMQLKDEFRTYETLRQEHDSQIVQIAVEAGLLIPPEQYSLLLYGSITYKSYMQSIIDRIEKQNSFERSMQVLMLGYQRTGEPVNYQGIRIDLRQLGKIEEAPDKTSAPSMRTLSIVLKALNNIVNCLIEYEGKHGLKKLSVVSEDNSDCLSGSGDGRHNSGLRHISTRFNSSAAQEHGNPEGEFPVCNNLIDNLSNVDFSTNKTDRLNLRRACTNSTTSTSTSNSASASTSASTSTSTASASTSASTSTSTNCNGAAEKPSKQKFKIAMCRDLNRGGYCPRGSLCTFAHSREELMTHRERLADYPQCRSKEILTIKNKTYGATASTTTNELQNWRHRPTTTTTTTMITTTTTTTKTTSPIVGRHELTNRNGFALNSAALSNFDCSDQLINLMYSNSKKSHVSTLWRNIPPAIAATSSSAILESKALCLLPYCTSTEFVLSAGPQAQNYIQADIRGKRRGPPPEEEYKATSAAIRLDDVQPLHCINEQIEKNLKTDHSSLYQQPIYDRLCLACQALIRGEIKKYDHRSDETGNQKQLPDSDSTVISSYSFPRNEALSSFGKVIHNAVESSQAANYNEQLAKPPTCNNTLIQQSSVSAEDTKSWRNNANKQNGQCTYFPDVPDLLERLDFSKDCGVSDKLTLMEATYNKLFSNDELRNLENIAKCSTQIPDTQQRNEVAAFVTSDFKYLSDETFSLREKREEFKKSQTISVLDKAIGMYWSDAWDQVTSGNVLLDPNDPRLPQI